MHWLPAPRIQPCADVVRVTNFIIVIIKYICEASVCAVITQRATQRKCVPTPVAFEWLSFLANVNSCSCSLYVVVRPSVCRLSVVCNVRAPYSGDWNFRQCFYAIWYLGHDLRPFGKNFTEIVPGEPLRRGVKPKGVEKCTNGAF